MKEGAFALIDCLGFKGIWARSEGKILEKISSINQVVRDSMPEFLKQTKVEIDLGLYDYGIKLLSDSVAINVHKKLDANIIEHSELVVIAGLVKAVAHLYLSGEPHLVLRGCVAYGRYAINENFIVGPAVDAAAEYMDSAEGAFVWYLPPASRMLEEYCDLENRPSIIKSVFASYFPIYEVPIKGKHFICTRVISPLYMENANKTEAVIKEYNEAMQANKMDVWLKRQYTLSFLNYCKEMNSELMKQTVVG
jgi:hypothetical protein